jgi:quercetin 2,3-dioxygenase
MKIIHKEDLHYGGFAGLREHRLVMHSRIFGYHKDPATADGLGNFLYLADAKFNPKGETRMHPHHEVDVISVMVEGKIDHEGSLEHGASVHEGEVQVQRAGGEGFRHNEINPDDIPNRMIQLWFAPETLGEKADYQLYKKSDDKVVRVYGGKSGKPFKAKTIMEIITLQEGESFEQTGAFQAYLIKGSLSSQNIILNDGDFFEDEIMNVKAVVLSKFILIYLEK